MNFLEYILVDMRATLGGFTMFGPRFSWLFLLSAAVIALIWYQRGPGERWSFSNAFRKTFPSRVFLHPSALLDYRYAVVNYFLRIVAFGVFLTSGDMAATATAGMLDSVLGTVDPLGAQAGVIAIALTIVLLVLALDFGLFLAHILMHKIPILWEFHKVHHSAETLTPATVFRNHPVDMMFNSWVVAGCVGVVNGTFLYLFPDPANAKWLVLSDTVVFTFYLFGYHLRHSHVWIMFPKGIRQIISSPALHLIHHSADKEHWDKNFGRIFVIWDKMVGAACIPDKPLDIRFGIGTEEDGEYNSVSALYFLPFRKAARLLLRRDPPASEPAPAPQSSGPVAG